MKVQPVGLCLLAGHLMQAALVVQEHACEGAVEGHFKYYRIPTALRPWTLHYCGLCLGFLDDACLSNPANSSLKRALARHLKFIAKHFDDVWLTCSALQCVICCVALLQLRFAPQRESTAQHTLTKIQLNSWTCWAAVRFSYTQNIKFNAFYVVIKQRQSSNKYQHHG